MRVGGPCLMRTYFVVNPRSANGSTGKRWRGLGALLVRKFSNFEVAFTKASGDAIELTRAALDQGYERIIAVGGDGTVNEVVNGFFREDKPIQPKAVLGVLSRGTGGDFRRHFGWSTNFEASIERLTTTGTIPLDVGVADFRGHDGQPLRRYFANVFSFGVSGAVADRVNNTSKVLGGRLSFLIASLRSLASHRDARVRIRLDGGPPESHQVTTLAVANCRYFGGGMKVAPEATASDGIFDVTIWSGYHLSDFVLGANAVYSGAHTEWSRTLQRKAMTVEAESDERVLVDCDGEALGTLPAKIRILPHAILLQS